MNYIMLKKKIIHPTSLTLSAQGPFLDVRIWRLHVWTSDSPHYKNDKIEENLSEKFMQKHFSVVRVKNKRKTV